jgi:outer membrane lipase/esterase
MNQLRRAGLAQKEEVSFNGLQLRSNGRPVDLAQSYPELRSLTGGAASADSGSKRLGVFINGTVDMGDKDDSANERGFSYSGSDMTFGVDYVLPNASFMGMAFGLSSSSATLNGGRGKLDNNGYNIIVYASILPIPEMYLDANIVIGGNSFEQDRRMVYNDVDGAGNPIAIDQTASATYFGDQFSASLTTGRDFVRGSLTMSPYAVIQVLNSSTNDYNEAVSDNTASGAGFALQIDGQDYESTTLTVGGQFTYVVNTSSGVLIPQVKLELIKEFQDGINVVSGNFIGDPLKQKFRLPTDKPDDSYMQLGLGTTGIIPGGTSYYVFYQTYLGYENLSQSSINLGMRWEL